MHTKKYVPFLLIAALVLGVVAVWWLFSDDSLKQPDDGRGVAGEPIDVALGFYEEWLTEVQASSSDPFGKNIHNHQALSQELSDRLWSERESNPEALLDPILCQLEPPSGLRTLPIYEQEAAAKFLVMAAEKGKSGQSVVTLEKTGDLWRVVDITCGSAESDPNQGEFSFDREGFLLKNVPAPLNSEYWHLVFEEDGEMGYTAPLFLDDSSICVRGDAEAVCDQSQFVETDKVKVQGQMSEVGVEVKRIEF